MNETLHIRIIKDYAANIISDLKILGAVEELTDEEVTEIPQWQKDEVLKAKEFYSKHPDKLLSWDDLLTQLKRK